MERTIDRTSYRRSARGNVRENVSSHQKDNKCFCFINVLLNQIIVSLLIVVLILVADYFDVVNVKEWIEKNISNGYEVSEIFALVKNKFNFDKVNTFSISGEIFKPSGVGILISGDASGEVSGEVKFITAVEGINQMSEDAKTINNNYDFCLPLKGTVTSEFGCRESSNSVVSSYHTGLDIAANTGTEIFAAHGGTVTLAKTYSTYGKCIIIKDGELQTLYAHCSSLNVKEGQNINKGDVIGKVGMTGNATGPHLHFEVKYEGRFVDPKVVLGEI